MNAGQQRPGFNDMLPCGTPSALKRHTALVEHCPVCSTDGRRVPLPTLAEIVRRRRQGRAQEAA